MTAAKNSVERIRLGSSDLNVSPLGVGTNAWGTGGKPDPEMKAAFEAALAAGINFFDTAEIYTMGGSERTLALCLQPAPKDVVIATKFMPLPWRLRKSSLADALKASLARLGLPRVDLYMTHFPFPPVAIETWMDALADARKPASSAPRASPITTRRNCAGRTPGFPSAVFRWRAIRWNTACCGADPNAKGCSPPAANWG